MLEDVLRSYALDFQGAWANTYLWQSFPTIIGSTCEALYKRKCRLAIHWYETGEQKYLGPELMEQATKEIEKIRCPMKTSQIQQKCYADKRRKPIKVIIGEHMFLKVSSM